MLDDELRMGVDVVAVGDAGLRKQVRGAPDSRSASGIAHTDRESLSR